MNTPPAYIIRNEHDKVLKDLNENEIANMVVGYMPSRTINGVYRQISIANDELIERLRKKYWFRDNKNHLKRNI